MSQRKVSETEDAMASLIVELSLEHRELPFLEVSEVASSLGDAIERSGSWTALVRSERNAPHLDYCNRMALAGSVSSLLFADKDLEHIKDALHTTDLPAGAYAVRVSARDRETRKVAPVIEREMGSVIADRVSFNLKSPDRVIRIIRDGDWYCCLQMCCVDRRGFAGRHGNKRPFNLPVSLHPRLARALLNLCHVGSGTRLLDPFCGTGGILIEGALLGSAAIGADIDARMIRGATLNLSSLGLLSACTLYNMDAGDIVKLGTFDAVVTDPPYGRSSFRTEPISSLYARAFAAISSVLREGGRLGIVLPDMSLLPRSQELRCLYHAEVKVHASLTRHFLVFEKTS
ncbi:MAG: methyltransferase domain-containing protein [Methanomassiliicoccales archaeon]